MTTHIDTNFHFMPRINNPLIRCQCYGASCKDTYTGQGGPCPAGSFCGVGTKEPRLCPAGKYQPDEGKSECIDCPKGYYCEIGTSDITEKKCKKG